MTWSSTCVINNSTGSGRFKITDTKLYFPVVTLSTLLQQIKPGFKWTTNRNKYQSNPKTYAQSRYLNHLVDLSFQGVNRLFLLSFENKDDRRSHSNYYLTKVKLKDYNVMIDGNFFFDQPINNDFKTWKHWKNCHWLRRWLHNWLFVRLSLFQNNNNNEWQ